MIIIVIVSIAEAEGRSDENSCTLLCWMGFYCHALRCLVRYHFVYCIVPYCIVVDCISLHRLLLLLFIGLCCFA